MISQIGKWVVLFCLLFSLQSYASLPPLIDIKIQDISGKELKKITIDSIFKVIVTVSGVHKLSKNDIELLSNDSCTILSFQDFVIQRKSNELSYTATFETIATKAGTLPIACQVKYNNTLFTSKTLFINAVNSPAKELKDIIKGKHVYSLLSVDKKNAYIGETITGTLAIYYSTGTINKIFDPFAKLAPAVTCTSLEFVEKRKEMIHGQQYTVEEYEFKCAAQDAGSITIPSFAIELVIATSIPMGFWAIPSCDFKHNESNIVTVHIDPLPINKKVDLVAQHVEISSYVDQSRCKQHEGITLTVTITSDAMVHNLEPDLKKIIPTSCKFFPITSDMMSLDRHTGLMTRKYEYTLQPMEDGILEIHPICISYFDPGLKQIFVAESGRLHIEVLPGIVPQSDKKSQELSNHVNNTKAPVAILPFRKNKYHPSVPLFLPYWAIILLLLYSFFAVYGMSIKDFMVNYIITPEIRAQYLLRWFKKNEMGSEYVFEVFRYYTSFVLKKNVTDITIQDIQQLEKFLAKEYAYEWTNFVDALAQTKYHEYTHKKGSLVCEAGEWLTRFSHSRHHVILTYVKKVVS